MTRESAESANAQPSRQVAEVVHFVGWPDRLTLCDSHDADAVTDGDSDLVTCEDCLTALTGAGLHDEHAHAVAMGSFDEHVDGCTVESGVCTCPPESDDPQPNLRAFRIPGLPVVASRSYTVGLPVVVTVRDDGRVDAWVDLSEASSELWEGSGEQGLPEHVVIADQQRIDAALAAGKIGVRA